TVQETVDSLEYVRQLFENGCIQSGFFHRFTCTVHSPVGLDPAAYGIELETTVPLTAGDRGDLQLIPQDEHQSPRLVSENCRLLGVKQTERTTRIVAAVTPEEATLLDDAQRKGRLNFILRNPRENQLQRKRKSHLRTRKKPTVEVITEE
ncbi:MAG: hypothetical protein EB078_08330, partial [Proteobacteria bacterium]|nr:hypothetical protein [Pseudomonadota bacterium]NDD04898.1 hypothetical protein [Pseudomonadota bacterium]